jgi:ankyrin repeat protein
MREYNDKQEVGRMNRPHLSPNMPIKAVVVAVVAIFVVLLAFRAYDSDLFLQISNLVDPLEANDKDARLDHSIQYDNYEGVKEAVESGANTTAMTYKNIFGTHVESVMLWVMEREASGCIMEYLLENGSDPNYADKYGITLLMSSVGASGTNISMSNYNDAEYTQRFLDYGADVNMKDRKGNSAFDHALTEGDIEMQEKCQRILLDNGASVTENTVRVLDKMIKDKSITLYDTKMDVVTEVYKRAKANGIEVEVDPVIEKLVFGDIKGGNELIRSNKYSGGYIESLLYFASAKGTEETMSLFADREGSFFENYDSAFYMFTTAAENGNVEVMEYLIEKGYFPANIEDNDPDAEYLFTPLDYAVKNTQFDSVEYLLRQGAVLTVADEDDSDTDTLRYAAESPNAYDMLKLIFDYRNDEISEASYSAAIRGVIEGGDDKALIYLLDQSKAAGYPQETEALILACGRSHDKGESALGQVKILAERGADLNGAYQKTADAYGEPLIEASGSGNAETVKYLIEHGADVNAYSTYSEELPLDAAVDQGYFEIVKLLVENGATIPRDFNWEWHRETGSQRIYEYLRSVAR